jgi:hypothetical protein
MRETNENISLRGKRFSIETLFLFFVWNTKFSVQDYGSYNDTERRKEENEQRRRERNTDSVTRRERKRNTKRKIKERWK